MIDFSCENRLKVWHAYKVNHWKELDETWHVNGVTIVGVPFCGRKKDYGDMEKQLKVRIVCHFCSLWPLLKIVVFLYWLVVFSSFNVDLSAPAEKCHRNKRPLSVSSTKWQESVSSLPGRCCIKCNQVLSTESKAITCVDHGYTLNARSFIEVVMDLTCSWSWWLSHHIDFPKLHRIYFCTNSLMQQLYFKS